MGDNIWKLCLILFILSSSCFGQLAFLDTVFFSSCVRIRSYEYNETSNKTITTQATAFITIIPKVDFGPYCPKILITCRHAVTDSSGLPVDSIRIIYYPRFPEIGEKDTIIVVGSKNLFLSKDPKIDIAGIKICMTQGGRATVLDSTILGSESDIFVGQEIFHLGYPKGATGYRGSYPLFKHGYISAINTDQYKTQQAFLIDQPTFQGSSGGPVFAYAPEIYKDCKILVQTPRLIGMVVSTRTPYEDFGICLPITSIQSFIDEIGNYYSIKGYVSPWVEIK